MNKNEPFDTILKNEQELIAQNTEQLSYAIDSYFKYSALFEIKNDFHPKFFKNLSEQNAFAKQTLRSLFRKHPDYDPTMDTIVLKNVPLIIDDQSKFDKLKTIVTILFEPCINTCHNGVYFNKSDIGVITEMLAKKPSALRYNVTSIMKYFLKDKYNPNKKAIRTFLQLAKTFNIYDEKKGSVFQKLFAKLSDILSDKKSHFTLYISLNPAHILTMSNPKKDNRGNMLTTCCSLSDQNELYANSCTAYTKDLVTFIVFTTPEFSDIEAQYNRKTTRQLYSYDTTSGLLLQNRLYTTFDGSDKHSDLFDQYGQIIKEVIAKIEGVENKWTNDIEEPDLIKRIEMHDDYTGFPDWVYNRCVTMVSLLEKPNNTQTNLIIGEMSTCIHCNKETHDGFYCNSCYNKIFPKSCCLCQKVYRKNTLLHYHNIGHVCEKCASDQIAACDYCGKDTLWEDLCTTDTGELLCKSCNLEIATQTQ